MHSEAATTLPSRKNAAFPATSDHVQLLASVKGGGKQSLYKGSPHVTTPGPTGSASTPPPTGTPKLKHQESAGPPLQICKMWGGSRFPALSPHPCAIQMPQELDSSPQGVSFVIILIT